MKSDFIQLTAYSDVCILDIEREINLIRFASNLEIINYVKYSIYIFDIWRYFFNVIKSDLITINYV